MNSVVKFPSSLQDEDRQLARYLREVEGVEDPVVLLGAACAMAAARAGHSCLELEHPPVFLSEDSSLEDWPSMEEWNEALRACASVSQESNDKPLVYAPGESLYLQRYWEHEQALAQELLRRAASTDKEFAASQIDEALSSFFDEESAQAKAARNALMRNFSAIIGGPGTGKTTTILKMLAAAMSLKLSEQWRIALAAPTGKAAARMRESIAQGLEKLSLPQAIANALPREASTLHRLLGSIPNSARFRHDTRNPLPFNCIVIDEASMIDLPLMRRFLQAVPPHCKIVLLGDPDQLSSVQVGSVLRDIASAATQPGNPLEHCLTELSKTYRFSDDSGIAKLCLAAKSGDAGMLEATIKDEANASELAYFSLTTEHAANSWRALEQRILEHSASIVSANGAANALNKLGMFQVLCPTNIGPWGTRKLNQRIVEALQGKRQREAPAFHGMPLLVMENSYELELFNGDVGLLWQESGGETLRAWFIGANGETRNYALAQLPLHEPCFAMTIHKSQGSEFEEVAVVFPESFAKRGTRELLYTAASRARSKLALYSSLDTLTEIIERPAIRATGLEDLLSTRS